MAGVDLVSCKRTFFPAQPLKVFVGQIVRAAARDQIVIHILVKDSLVILSLIRSPVQAGVIVNFIDVQMGQCVPIFSICTEHRLRGQLAVEHGASLDPFVSHGFAVQQEKTFFRDTADGQVCCWECRQRNRFVLHSGI